MSMSEDTSSQNPNYPAGVFDTQVKPSLNGSEQTTQVNDPRYGQQGDLRMSQQDNYHRQTQQPQVKQNANHQQQDTDQSQTYYQTGHHQNQDIYAAQQQAAGQQPAQHTQPPQQHYEGQQTQYDPQHSAGQQQYAPQTPDYPQTQRASGYTHQNASPPAADPLTQPPSPYAAAPGTDYSQYTPQQQPDYGSQPHQQYDQGYSSAVDTSANASSYEQPQQSPYQGYEDPAQQSQGQQYTPDYDYGRTPASDYQAGYDPSHVAQQLEDPASLRMTESEMTSPAETTYGRYDQNGYDQAAAYDRDPAIFDQQSSFGQQSAYEQPQDFDRNQYGQIGGADQLYGENQSQSDAGFFDEDYDQEDYAEMDAPPKKRKSVMIAAALVGALALGGSLAYAFKYMGFGDSTKTASNPPVIQADKNPVKEKPILAGGKQFPNRNKLIYDRLQDNQDTNGTPEKIVSRQEKVFDTSNIARNLNNAETTSAIKPGSGSQANSQVAGLRPSTTNSVGDSTAPRKVKTLMVKPDGTIVKQPSGGTGFNSTIPNTRTTAVNQVKVQQVQKPAVTSSATKPIPERLAGTPKLTPPSSSSTTKNVAALPKKVQRPAVVNAPAVTGTGFAVQVAARRSQTEALAAYADLQQKYPSLLTNYRPIIQRADLGDKGVFYRLRVGPMTQKADASKLCSELKSAGLKSCWVLSL